MTAFEDTISALRAELDRIGRGDPCDHMGVCFASHRPMPIGADDLRALELNLIAIRGTAAFIGNVLGMDTRAWPS